MSCFTVSKVILQQLLQWAFGIFSFLESICNVVTQQVQQWQQQWQNVCSQVTTQVEQQQQQWQNQCSQVTSQVCNSLPWPLSDLCSWVTSTVCNVVSVLVMVIVTVIETVCNVVSVLILVVATVVQLVCTAVAIIIEIIVLVLILIIAVVIVVLCIVFPCRNPMESSIPPDNGWIVTLGLPTPPLLSAGNQIRILPDGQLACENMISAIKKAKATIHIVQLEFDKDFVATFSGSTAQTTLVDALIDAGSRDVRVRILLNDNLFADTLPQLQTAFSGRTSIELAGLKIQPFAHLGMMHAKGMFIDSAVAFVDGLPFAQGYWDTQLHLVTDSRRGSGAGGDFPPLGNIGNGVGNKPAHTVSLQLVGPAATSVDATFVSLWNSVSSDTVTVPSVAAGDGGQTVQIVRTAPALNAVGLSNEKGVLEAHLRAINNASTFIYIEVQYLTSPVIAQALIRALNARPQLQLILLLNENPDMPTYKFWQNQLLSQLATFPASQVGTFSLWRVKPPNGNPLPEIMQCYVEAKVSLVDDVWATVGSGNLDGASLGHIWEFLPSPLSCRSAAKGWRNVELNGVLYDGIAGQPATGEVARLRQILWREHLGLERLPDEPPLGGWLSLWSQIAGANLASLNASQAMTGSSSAPSRILPYATALQSIDQLNELGVNAALFDVAPVVPP
jgi:phosphatidylserine/phosphatidylglycerophosphate/cardiolipin synthase-like enzyme